MKTNRYIWIMKDRKTFLIFDTFSLKVISAWTDFIQVNKATLALNSHHIKNFFVKKAA